MSTDWRALCAELLDEVAARPLILDRELIARARAALAEPVAEGPSLEEVEELCEEHCFNVEGYESIECLQRLINDALARYGHQPAPSVEGEQRHPTPVPVAEPVAEGPTPSDEELLKLARAELNNSPNWEEPEYDASNPFPYEAPGIAWLNFARAVLARFGHQPAPVPVAEFDCPACEDVPIDTIRAALKRLQELENNADLGPAPAPAGKAAEVMGLFRRWADAYPDGVMVDPYWLTRAADLLEQFSSGWVVPTVEQFAPVPVAERLPDASDPRECRMPDGSCWWFDPHEDGAWYFDAYQSNYTHWLPAHALPLPYGEVE